MPQPRDRRAGRSRSVLHAALCVSAALACLALWVPGKSARAQSAEPPPPALVSCGKLRPAGPRCLQLRGAPRIEAGRLLVPISYLESASGQPVAQPEFTLHAEAAPELRPLQAVVSKQAVDLVVVAERYQQKLVERKEQRTGATLRLIRESLGELFAAVQEVPGSHVRMLPYGFDVQPMKDDAAGAEDDAGAALKALDFQAPGGGSSYVLNDALAIGLGAFLRSADKARGRPVLLVLSDGRVANQVTNEPAHRLLGYAAAQAGVTIDVVGFAGADEVQEDFYALAQQTDGVVRKPDSGQLQGALRALTQELTQQLVLEFTLPAVASGSQPRNLRIQSATGDRLSIPAQKDWPITIPPPVINPPQPAIPESAKERSGSGLDWLLAVGFFGLGLLLMGGTTATALRLSRMRRGTGARPGSSLKHEPSVAWVVPLSGPARFRTFAVGSAGLSIGNDATCDCYVPALPQAGLRFQIRRSAANREYQLYCPPGSAITVGGERCEGTLGMRDGMSFSVGSVLFAFKQCGLEPEAGRAASTGAEG